MDERQRNLLCDICISPMHGSVVLGLHRLKKNIRGIVNRFLTGHNTPNIEFKFQFKFNNSFYQCKK